MKLRALHQKEKEVSATSLFKGEIGSATAIQLQEKAELKEHITKTPALLLCVTGKTIYEDETGQKAELLPGDYINIIPNVKHWLVASKLSELVLFK